MWITLRNTQQHIELLYKFSKVKRQKVNIQKPKVFLYTSKESSKNYVENTILFKIPSKRIKCLGITETKEMQDLYTENHKTYL